MNKIVISLDNQNINYSNIVQGIKYFSIKKKNIQLYIVGKQKDINSLTKTNSVHLLFSHNLVPKLLFHILFYEKHIF